MNLQPGQIVRVRSRKYLVEGVVPPPEPTDSPLVRLSCVEDDALGEPLEVLWDKEIDAQAIGRGELGGDRQPAASTSPACSRPTSTPCAGTA